MRKEVHWHGPSLISDGQVDFSCQNMWSGTARSSLRRINTLHMGKPCLAIMGRQSVYTVSLVCRPMLLLLGKRQQVTECMSGMKPMHFVGR